MTTSTRSEPATSTRTEPGPDQRRRYDFVIAANRLPVERDERGNWRRSPGGLVTAMDSVMRGRDGAWVGWAGEPGDAPEPFDDAGMHLHPVALSKQEVADYYEGFSNDTLWPIYHDVIVPATFKRRWWDAYQKVNQRFAEALAEVADEGAVVWIHDYQLQLVPRMLRRLRPDVKVGWYNHIPFPPVELFAQLPWRGQIIDGLLGADFLGFQRAADATNFLQACRRIRGLTVKGEVAQYHGDDGATRSVRAAAVPISIDFDAFDSRARSPEVKKRAAELRAQLGNPRVLMLGVDRLDYTKGIRHRLKAYEELLADGHINPPDVTLVQVAVPSRERVEAYKRLRGQVEETVGRINGQYSHIGAPAVHYLHQSFDPVEMAALYQIADVMLVTPLRDGMNLVAKEYVASCWHLDGALVLSEFTGAARELHRAYQCNPHDIEGLKQTILGVLQSNPDDRRARMRQLRRSVSSHDVYRWARIFLASLDAAPQRPPKDGGKDAKAAAKDAQRDSDDGTADRRAGEGAS